MLHERRELNERKLSYQQQLSSQMVTAVVVLNANLTIEYVNPAAETLFVKSFNKLSGLYLSDIFHASTFDKTRFEQLLQTGQEFTNNDIELQFISGHKITVDITASPVDFNNTPHVLLEFKQIDQQKQINLEVFQQQQWESGRDLIRGLAHEIKNPLGGLRGAAQLLNRELNTSQQEYTAMIIEQADRLTNLVDRLLGPNQLPNIKPHNIHGVLEKVFRVITFDDSHKVKLIRDYDPSIPELLLDDEKIQQTVLNIVKNASQAIVEKNGTITLKTRIASNPIISGKKVKLAVQLSIIDDGPGIPVHIQDTLFYPMVSGRSDGTGLGLSISQTLIHQHNGKLSCISRPGRTEFIILLPIAEENTK